MPVTLKQIAEVAGVSRPTANLILLGKGQRFSAATRERVQAAAASLNYRPNLYARGLSQSRSFLIGVLVSHDYVNHYAEFSTLLQQLVLARGYLPVTAISHDAVSQRAMLSRLIDARVDAILINREWNDEDGSLTRLIENTRSSGVPIMDLFVEHSTEEPSTSIDWVDAGRLGFVTLQGLGLKHLAFWTPLLPQTGGTTNNLEEKHLQWRGWLNVSKQSSTSSRLVVHELLPLRSPQAPVRGSALYRAAAELMSGRDGPVPDGVFACSTNAAAHLSLYLHDHPEKKPAGFTIAHWADALVEREARERRVRLRIGTERLSQNAVTAAFAAINKEPVASTRIGPTITIMEPA